MFILQPFKEEPAEDYKCKDKFLVQTAPLDETLEKQDVTSLWSHIEASDRQSMRQHKIKCVFVGPKDESDEPVEQEEPFEQPVPTEPVKEQVTAEDTERQVPIHNDVILPPTLPKVPQPAPVDDTPIIKQETQAPPVVAENDEARKQLKEALEKIKRLETELEELKKQREVSRKEGNVVGGRKLSPTVQPLDAVHQHLAQLEKPRAVEGYPPQVLLGVSILVFIFTYLFF
ncbi:hypothetical protein G6F56_011988 [Rhizopus delemar]|nr:hypothetical protein G6F56_011988 [Rhizopus delemar]